jgi:AmmeMemoRadiSam system protein A
MARYDVIGVMAPHPPIMVPAVGKGDAEVTHASAVALGRAAQFIDAFDPDTIVLMSPHAPAVADAFLVDDAAIHGGSMADFGAPGVAIEARGDPELARRIVELANGVAGPVILRADAGPRTSGRLSHGELVPLSFLDPSSRYRLVVLSLSWLPYEAHRAFGDRVAEAARSLDRRIVFLASGDCSHRLQPGAPAGFSPRASVFDAELVRKIDAGDLEGLMHFDPGLVEAAGECGLRSFVTLGGVMPGARTRVLAYEGPWGVGYMTAVAGFPATIEALDAEALFEPAPGSPAAPTTPEVGHKGGEAGHDESLHTKLARKTIERYVRRREFLANLTGFEDLAAQHAGAFVSLHREQDLRGCIGTIEPVRANLAEEIVHNAVEAATADPRFDPLRADELADLEISVDVLHEPEPVASLDELDPRHYGVIVASGWRRGLLLPDLEGVDTAEQQVTIAMRKAGIQSDQPVRLERFRVDRYR